MAPLPTYQPPATCALDPGQHRWVLISFGSYLTSFEPLVDWRRQMGFSPEVVNLLWIYLNYPGNSNQEKLRAFIQDARANWGTTYFLLGGDTTLIPVQQHYLHGEWVPNDTYYSDLNDDWIIDVAVGRACVNGTTQADTFVNKILTYEKNPPANFGSKVFFMGFDLDGATHGENCKKSIKTMWMPTGTTFCREYDSETGDHLGDVIAYMNDGQNLVNHVDHCGTSYLGVACVNHGTGLDGNGASGFTNGQRYSNFYTLGCWAGNFPDTCWGEYLCFDDQGGISYVGNTRSGIYHVGYTNTLSHLYEKKWWQALWAKDAWRAGIPWPCPRISITRVRRSSSTSSPSSTCWAIRPCTS